MTHNCNITYSKAVTTRSQKNESRRNGNKEDIKTKQQKAGHVPFDKKNRFYLMLISTGYLAPLAPMVIPGSQYSNFYF